MHLVIFHAFVDANLPRSQIGCDVNLVTIDFMSFFVHQVNELKNSTASVSQVLELMKDIQLVPQENMHGGDLMSVASVLAQSVKESTRILQNLNESAATNAANNISQVKSWRTFYYEVSCCKRCLFWSCCHNFGGNLYSVHELQMITCVNFDAIVAFLNKVYIICAFEYFMETVSFMVLWA